MFNIKKPDNKTPPQAQRLKSHKRKLQKAQKAQKAKQRNFSRKKFWLKICKLFFVIGLIISVIFSIKYMYQHRFSVIEQVRVTTDSKLLNPQDIKEIIKTSLHKQDSFFRFKTTELRTKLKEIPWIGHVIIKRQWPNMLLIDIEEQKPIAKWNNIALINSKNELFMPQQQTFPDNLPLLYGPDEEASNVVYNYISMQQMLISLGFSIKSLGINQEDTWHMILNDNIDVFLGNENIMSRVKNFIIAYPKIKADNPDKHIASVDLRYPAGVAIHWN